MMKYVFAATATTLLCTAANAEMRPNNSPNEGATVDQVSECAVTNDPSDYSSYVVVPCSGAWVNHNDNDGNWAYSLYHDSARLPAGMEAPDEVVTTYITFPLGGLDCTGREIITPGGTYRSEYRCK